MSLAEKLDTIFDTKAKVRILRLFASRTDDFMASGNEIARMIGLTPPAAHAALKKLYGGGVLSFRILGRQHIYGLQNSSRLVRDIVRPAFLKERTAREEMGRFLTDKLTSHKIKRLIISLLLYGSVARGKEDDTSDCDVAVIVKDPSSLKHVEDVFLDKISAEFSEYFGVHLDPYIKAYHDFICRKGKKLSPVADLMRSYIVIYGRDPATYRD